MDSFELNKVAGAALGALLLAVGSGFVAELIYHPKPAGNAGYDLPLPEPVAAGGGAETAKVEPIAVRLASANVEKGSTGTKACHACHSFDKGGANKVGPALWDVVERKKGGHEGYDYSAAMKEKGGAWSYEDLDHFLENPKAYVKGTKMAYAGIASAQDRANVVAYLHSLSDSPKPLPVAEKKEEAKPAEGKPAEGKPAEGKPAEGKPAEGKPAESMPADAAKPADKPAEATADKPAASKPSEGKDSPAKPADKGAEPVLEKAPGSPKPTPETENRNETAPKPAPESSGPTPSAPDGAAPAAPSEAPATQPPAQADPAAEQKAKDIDVGK